MRILKCIYPFTVICICFLSSCESAKGDKKFFDIPGYFESEIDSIKSNFTKVEKTYVYNGDTNRKELKVVDIDWTKELAFFLECDINKPVYYANMVEISTPSHAAIPTFGWSDLSKKLPIRYVMVGGWHYGNAPYTSTNLIQVQIIKSNLISETIIDAQYEKAKGYSISGEQKIKNLGDKNTFFVEGKFLE